jgi:hypothetical protein
MAYNAIIAIQSSAFLMTLYRKRIIKGRYVTYQSHVISHALVFDSCDVINALYSN